MQLQGIYDDWFLRNHVNVDKADDEEDAEDDFISLGSKFLATFLLTASSVTWYCRDFCDLCMRKGSLV